MLAKKYNNMNKDIITILDDVPLIKRILILGLLVVFLQFVFPQSTSASFLVRFPIENVYLSAPNSNITAPFISNEAYHQTLQYNQILKNQYDVKKIMKVSVSAYSSTVDQCDSTPFITASGTHVRDGIIAANFIPIGTKVRFPEIYGDKVFIVEDRMNARYYYKADIWMQTREQAKQWGVKYLTIEILKS
jgi:3D (Asp-Asp-Asp) domain-containing protein